MTHHVVVFEDTSGSLSFQTRFISQYRNGNQKWLTDDIYEAQKFADPFVAHSVGLQIAQISLADIDRPLWQTKFRLMCDHVAAAGSTGSLIFQASLIRDIAMGVCELHDREPPAPDADVECHEPIWELTKPAVMVNYLTYAGFRAGPVVIRVN